jgi:hypothetical protein
MFCRRVKVPVGYCFDNQMLNQLIFYFLSTPKFKFHEAHWLWKSLRRNIDLIESESALMLPTLATSILRFHLTFQSFEHSFIKLLPYGVRSSHCKYRNALQTRNPPTLVSFPLHFMKRILPSIENFQLHAMPNEHRRGQKGWDLDETQHAMMSAGMKRFHHVDFVFIVRSSLFPFFLLTQN